MLKKLSEKSSLMPENLAAQWVISDFDFLLYDQQSTVIIVRLIIMNLNQVLEATQRFSYEEIELLIGILYKRHIEARRNEIAVNAQEAIEAFHRGELKTETADNLIKRLQNSFKFKEENNDSDKVNSAF